MRLANKEFISTVEERYFSWHLTRAKERTVHLTVENIALTIVFNQSRWIYPTPNPYIFQYIERTVNITSIDNQKIKEIFEKLLVQKEGIFNFPNHPENTFKLRFFQKEQDIIDLLLEEERKYTPLEGPWTTKEPVYSA